MYLGSEEYIPRYHILYVNMIECYNHLFQSKPTDMDPVEKVASFIREHGRGPNREELKEMNLGNNVGKVLAGAAMNDNAAPANLREYIQEKIEDGKADENTDFVIIRRNPNDSNILIYAYPRSTET